MNYSNFCPDFFDHVGERLDKKAQRLISKFMTLQTKRQKITIHILPNISRSKVNQTIKFGQVIEYNMRNIFQEKLYLTCGGEATTMVIIF